MTQITIPAQVVNGHLQHEKSLPELEGQHVLATLTVTPTTSAKDHGQAHIEELRPQPEFVWSDRFYRARKAAEAFSRGTHADY